MKVHFSVFFLKEGPLFSPRLLKRRAHFSSFHEGQMQACEAPAGGPFLGLDGCSSVATLWMRGGAGGAGGVHRAGAQASGAGGRNAAQVQAGVGGVGIHPSHCTFTGG